jgi:hypothetical protein
VSGRKPGHRYKTLAGEVVELYLDSDKPDVAAEFKCLGCGETWEFSPHGPSERDVLRPKMLRPKEEVISDARGAANHHAGRCRGIPVSQS